MIDHGLQTWLGPAYDELDAEQLDRFARRATNIDTLYPDPDDQDSRDAALSAVVQYLLGDTDPEEAGRALRRARDAEMMAMAAAQQIATMAVEDGAPVAPTARTIGVDRMTVLKWLGKR